MSALSTELRIQGKLINSSAANIDTEATALSGASVQWGRSGILDQPEPSVMTCQLALPAEAATDLIDDISQGSGIHLRAVATVPDDSQRIISSAANVMMISGTNRPVGSRQALTPVAPNRDITAIIPPGVYTEPMGSGWERIPATGPGGKWRIRLQLQTPPNSETHVYPLLLGGPSGGDSLTEPVIASKLGAGTLSVDTEYSPPAEYVGYWLGLMITVFDAGSTWAQKTQAWSAVATAWRDEPACWIDSATIDLVGAGTYTATVFKGRISDVVTSWHDALRRPVMNITAVDFLAELANQTIGDDPWPQETAAARAQRIINLSQQPLQVAFAAPAKDLQLARVDIDSQPVRSLLAGLATSTGTILWPVHGQGSANYLHYEDPTSRPAAYQLEIPPTGPARLGLSAASFPRLPSSLLDRRGVEIVKNPGEVASTIKVGYPIVTETPDGKLQRSEQQVSLTDQARRLAIGDRSISISTDLAKAMDAETLAAKALAFYSPIGFMIEGLTWATDLPGSEDLTVLALLDVSRRIGSPLIITDLPTWVPGNPSIPVYLEGGTYTLTGGKWTLALSASKASTPASSVKWQQAPASLTWPRMSALTWNDIALAHL